MSRRSDRSARRGRLAVILVVVGCLLVAALVDRSGSSSSSSNQQLVALGPRVPAADAVETAWYCAEGTSNPGGRADERIYLANVDQRVAHARITVMQGPDVAPKVTSMDVPAGSLRAVRVADILAVAEPGVLVEVTGARAVVTHSVSGSNDAGFGPCARDAAPQWHFAAGTTVKGAALNLALFNPFADDAIVNIDFITDSGPLAPDDLQGFVVPGHSRVTVPVQDKARRDAIVATEVGARRGRVVAEQSQVLDGTDGRKGLALSLGAPELSNRWEFANASVVAGRTQTMVVANPAPVPTSATIRTRLDGGALEPETVNVPARTAVAVDLGRRVPPGIGFSVVVTGRTPVVAESLVAAVAPIVAADRGIATTIGTNRAARWWADVPARANGSSKDSIAVLNPGATTVTVRVTVMRAGRASTLSTAARVRIAAQKRAVVDLGTLKVPADAFVVVAATGPVVVERESTAMPGLTVAAAVPDLDR
ncbi:MAG: DUF5719 family protein [Acidimicrobiia bacterium]